MNFKNTYKIEITGVIAWALFSFATIKFIHIYIDTVLSHLLTYGICSLIFLLYFFTYYRSNFGLKKFLFLMLAFNIGFHLLDATYLWLINIREFDYDLGAMITMILADLFLCFFVYLGINKIISRYKK
jgi:hypothetical protein